ncbi:unnamed protein product [Alternaria alternata]
MSLYHSCDGDWIQLVDRCNISEDELNSFLGYAGLFLYNMGNYYAEGGQKFVPDMSRVSLERILQSSNSESSPSTELVDGIIKTPPFGLGYPSETLISNYYPDAHVTREEIAYVSKVLDKAGIEPENTRVRKCVDADGTHFEVLQAAVMTSREEIAQATKSDPGVYLVRGDHATELAAIHDHLKNALKYVGNQKQAEVLSHYIQSFETGNLAAFRESQKSWVKDLSPSIDNILGFVEPYRDPHGIRAEWEGIVCVADSTETKKMEAFVQNAAKFSKLLPWASADNDGKGPFEKASLEIPGFTIMHGLAVCCPWVWEAANLPNYHDIREDYGSKNILLANRMNANKSSVGSSKYLDSADAELYGKHLHIIRFVATVIHELLGHGTGKLLRESEPGKFNFDSSNPPLNPLTGTKVESWYLPGETWTGKFENLATTVEECRAILMSGYLIDNEELLDIFGFNDASDVTADDMVYLSYLHLAVEGLRSLEHYSVTDQAWSQAHSQGYFAIFKHLLQDGEGVVTVDFDGKASLVVKVDRSKIMSSGKPALGDMMNRLHIWRCIADTQSCQEYYGALTTVDGKYKEWREVVCLLPEARWKFVQANTFLVGDKVTVKEYDESDRGIIQSWAERDV